jgi:FecR protein
MVKSAAALHFFDWTAMRLFRFLAIAAMLATIGLCASNLNANQTAGWGVVVATNAYVSHVEGALVPVSTGASIVQGDRLTTKAGGALVLSRGEDLVTMAENSEIVITNPQPLHATLIEQPAGQVQYHVTKGPAPHFEVDAPLLATVVKGTTFSVTAGKTQSSVSVLEGRVVARNLRSGTSSSVGAGETGAVSASRGGVSVGASLSTGASSTPGSEDSSSSSEGSNDSSDSSSKGNSGSGNSNSGSSNGNSGSSNGNGNSGSSGSGNSNSGSSNSGSGSSSGGGNGKNGNGNANGHHDGKGKNG